MIYRDVITVSRLSISSSADGSQAATETHSAYASPDSDASEKTLWDAYQWRDEVTLRCASLEVRGIVSNVRYEGLDKVYELKVDHVAYHKKAHEKPAEVSL